MRIFLLGFMGSGKSYWVHHLSRELDIPWIDMDEEIVRAAGMTIAEIFAQKGEAHFRELERKVLHHILPRENFVASCGGGVPCYYDNMAVMNRTGITLWLDAPVEVLVKRLKTNRLKRPLIRDLDDDALRDYVEMKLRERRGFYAQAHLTIDTETETVDTIAQKIRTCISHS